MRALSLAALVTATCAQAVNVEAEHVEWREEVVQWIPTPIERPNLESPIKTEHLTGKVGPQPMGSVLYGSATYYGTWANGRRMGCGSIYSSGDSTIAAVAYPSRNTTWPCGTPLQITGPAGTIVVRRSDSCPGCGPNDIDLSESGFQRVCGSLSIGRCRVEIREMR